MKFNKITYSNYRCFLDGTIEFNTDNEKNMSVLIAPNGGGKTETLFSFWWTLYDFDFASLRNKENTPYAINSALYRELENEPTGSTKECSVTLEFEDNGEPWFLKKTCSYRKTDKRIKVEEYKELRYKKTNGEMSLPIRNKDLIEQKLESRIPKKILNGIIFDGERMQKLSSTDENSIAAIKGVINDISNVELLEKCKEYFSSINRKYNKELVRFKPKKGDMSLEKVIETLALKNDEKELSKSKLEQAEEEKEKIERELENISEKLQKNKEVKEIEFDRKIQKEQLEKKEKALDTFYKDFSDSLTNGYLFSSTKLLDDVKKIVEDYKVPEGLTVNAVKSIINREDHKCICGKYLDDEAVEKLTTLMKLLPPDNINSTLLEIVRSIQVGDIPTNKKMITNIYNQIRQEEAEIKDIKEKLANLSTRILSIDEDGEIAREAVELEKLNNENHQALGKIKNVILEEKENIKRLEPEINKLQTQRENMASDTKGSAKINKKVSFIEKSMQAIEKIREINKETALDDVNDKLAMAYPLLSEDYDRGRAIKIIQHNLNKKYQMAVYMKDDVERLLNIWKESGEYSKKITLGLSEEEIEEEAILKCVDSNSTGQSKINTFAFVKAILDYSNNPTQNSGIEVRKEYPLLIDAPFGDIASENLRKSSRELHNFSHQVILLIDEDKYETLREAFDPYIKDKYRFKKVDNKNHSIIEREE